METRIFEDHCDSYICWKTLGLKGITAVHADAHLDYRDMGISPATLAKIINTSDRKFWKRSAQLRASCGTALIPAITCIRL